LTFSRDTAPDEGIVSVNSVCLVVLSLLLVYGLSIAMACDSLFRQEMMFLKR
jgi:L-aminopeptidase/D-esterase-like protein